MMPRDLLAGPMRDHGFDISRFEKSFLEKTVQARMAVHEITSVYQYCDLVQCSQAEAAEFFSSLHVTFSEFFRSPLTFAMLEQVVLPRLIEEKRACGTGELRIWSAGCSTGQESYSLAIILDDLITSAGLPVTYRVFATDISEQVLSKAREGVYDHQSMNQVRLKHLDRYFLPLPLGWKVRDSIRNMIDFSLYDLLDHASSSPPGSIFGDFDLICCCNLLFYYDPQARDFIIEKLNHALADDGYLVCGETERVTVEYSGLFSVICREAALFQKKHRRDR